MTLSNWPWWVDVEWFFMLVAAERSKDHFLRYQLASSRWPS